LLTFDGSLRTSDLKLGLGSERLIDPDAGTRVLTTGIAWSHVRDRVPNALPSLRWRPWPAGVGASRG